MSRVSTDANLPPTDKEGSGRLIQRMTDLIRAISTQLNGISEGGISFATNADTAAPTTGTYAAGDYVANKARALGLYMGWVYGASSFIGVGQIGALKNTTANRPTKATLGVANDTDWVGYLYFDTTLDADGKPIWWSGSAWVDATGATV